MVCFLTNRIKVDKLGSWFEVVPFGIPGLNPDSVVVYLEVLKNANKATIISERITIMIGVANASTVLVAT